MRQIAVLSAILISTVLAAAPAAAAEPGPTAGASAGAAARPVPAPGTTGSPAQANGSNELSAMAEDGYFYAFEHHNWDTSAKYCRWDYGHADWKHPTWAMPNGGDCYNYGWTENYYLENMATSVWNNGFMDTRDSVMMYKDEGYEGAKMCLGRGDYWGNLALGWERFNDGSFANDEISSHAWTTACNL